MINLKGFGRKRLRHFCSGTGYFITVFILINTFPITLKSNQHTAPLTTQIVIISDIKGDRQEEQTIKTNLNAVVCLIGMEHMRINSVLNSDKNDF
jgi:hypothetical protein